MAYIEAGPIAGIDVHADAVAVPCRRRPVEYEATKAGQSPISLEERYP
jgi:hypothetical protein